VVMENLLHAMGVRLLQTNKTCKNCKLDAALLAYRQLLDDQVEDR